MILKKTTSLCSIPPDQITYEDIVETYRLEAMLFPSDRVPGPEVVKAWCDHNPLTLFGVRDTASGRLIGFLHALPVKDSLFDTIRSGHFDDTKFSVEDILVYDRPGTYKLYIASLCVHPNFNNTLKFFKIMYNTFFEVLIRLAQERGVIISEVVADGITEKGRVMCRGMGLKKQTQSAHGSEVYHGVLYPKKQASILLKGEGKRLLATYGGME